MFDYKYRLRLRELSLKDLELIIVAPYERHMVVLAMEWMDLAGIVLEGVIMENGVYHIQILA